MKLRYFFYFTFLFAMLNSIVYSQTMDSIVSYSPIGVFHTYYTSFTGAPRQGIQNPNTKGTIEIFDDYKEGLKYLSAFEYIIVLYHFNEVSGWDETIQPPGSDQSQEYGVFATRSPRRPNPIGFSIVKLEKI